MSEPKCGTCGDTGEIRYINYASGPETMRCPKGCTPPEPRCGTCFGSGLFCVAGACRTRDDGTCWVHRKTECLSPCPACGPSPDVGGNRPTTVHWCPNGERLKPWPSVVCSSCRTGDGPHAGVDYVLAAVPTMRDPTYARDEIEANPTWHMAWVLSEIMNDNAPIGWSGYIYAAEQLQRHYDIKPRAEPTREGGEILSDDGRGRNEVRD